METNELPSREYTDDGRRLYRFDPERAYPGTTTVTSTIAKPQLDGWKLREEQRELIKVAGRCYREELQTARKETRAPQNSTDFQKRIKDEIGGRFLSDAARDRGGQIGTEAHQLFEWKLRRRMGQTVLEEPVVSDKVLWASMAFDDWVQKTKPEPIAVEAIVWSDRFRYAGTLDLACKINGELILVDFKTGSKITTEALLQSVAYQQAWREMGHPPFVGGRSVRLPKKTSAPEYEEKVVPAFDELWPVFEAALTLDRFLYGEKA